MQTYSVTFDDDTLAQSARERTAPPDPPSTFVVSYDRFGQRTVDQFSLKTVAVAIAAHLASGLMTPVRVYEKLPTPAVTGYLRLLETVCP